MYRFVPLCVLLAACSNTLSGEIDGERVRSSQDAIFDVTEIPLVGTVVALAVTDADDACAVLDDLADVDGATTCDDACEEAARVGRDHLPDDAYYHLFAWIRVEDELVRTFDQDDDFGEDEFVATFTAVDTALFHDEAECLEECEDGASLYGEDIDEALGGVIEVTEYLPSEQLSGQVDVDFGGDDRVEGRFEASWCDLGAYFWWL